MVDLGYIMFGPPLYSPDGHYELTVSRGGTYFNTTVPRAEAVDLLADIARHLEIDAGRQMEWGDLGLTDPDDIAF